MLLSVSVSGTFFIVSGDDYYVKIFKVSKYSCRYSLHWLKIGVKLLLSWKELISRVLCLESEASHSATSGAHRLYNYTITSRMLHIVGRA